MPGSGRAWMALPASKTAWLASCTRRGQQRDVHDAFGNLAEAGEHGFDGEARGDFAALLSADAVGQREEPSLRLHLRGRGRGDVADEVLVVAAGEAGVGEFGKFKIEHGYESSLRH